MRSLRNAALVIAFACLPISSFAQGWTLEAVYPAYSQRIPQAPIRIPVSVTTADSTAPAVTITAPTASATYDAGSTSPLTTLAGTATDAVGIVNCVWANAATGSSGATSGTTSWSVASIVLADGSNVITVTCYDAAGNGPSGADTLTVTYASSASVCAHCIFETTFSVAQGWTIDRKDKTATCAGNGLGDYGSPGSNPIIQAGVNEGIDGTANHCEEINTASNYASGNGGRGQQKTITTGDNHNSGGLFIYPGGSGAWKTLHFYARWYVKYPNGAVIGYGAPSHKFLYWNGGTCGSHGGGCYLLWDGTNQTRLTRNGSNFTNALSSWGYTSLNGGVNNGDDTWHCVQVEMHSETAAAATSDGSAKVYVDGVERFRNTTVDYNNFQDGGFGNSFLFPSNGYWDVTGSGHIMLDDLAVSVTQLPACF